MNDEQHIAGGNGRMTWSLYVCASASGVPLRLVDADGKEHGRGTVTFPHPTPEGFSAKEEQHRLRSGGCCGQPSGE